MNDSLPTLTVVIVSFRRVEELKSVAYALEDNLRYSGNIKWIIADDSSPPEMQKEQQAVAEYLGGHFITTPQNGGWGVNVNHALQHDLIDDDDIIFQIENDYVMTRPYNVTAWVKLLSTNQELGIVRIDGISGHKVNAGLKEWEVEGYPKQFGWSLDVSSPEAWLYSNRPHLKHKRFWQACGLYPVGLKLGETELNYAMHVKQCMKRGIAPKIIAPHDRILPLFDHIGESFQHTEHDKGK